MCPYNATHRLFKEELEEHITTCSARNVLNEIYPGFFYILFLIFSSLILLLKYYIS